MFVLIAKIAWKSPRIACVKFCPALSFPRVTVGSRLKASFSITCMNSFCIRVLCTCSLNDTRNCNVVKDSRSTYVHVDVAFQQFNNKV